MEGDSAVAQRVATHALSLARSGVEAPDGAAVLFAFAWGRRSALVLARARCLAAVDQRPSDAAARRALELLDLALAQVDG